MKHAEREAQCRSLSNMDSSFKNEKCKSNANFHKRLSVTCGHYVCRFKVSSLLGTFTNVSLIMRKVTVEEMNWAQATITVSALHMLDMLPEVILQNSVS